MALSDFERAGETTIINTAIIPASIPKTYREKLEGYHPTVGSKLNAFVKADCLNIEVSGTNWPDPAKELMETLQFVAVPGKKAATLLVARPGFRTSFAPWELRNVHLEKTGNQVDGVDEQQLLLQWFVPGHEFVYTAWKW